MEAPNFKALLLNQEDKKTLSSVATLTADNLPEGDTLVKVSYSSINYKDALAVTGKGKIIREFPFVPGIDLVGEVVEGGDDRIKPGMSVILTGWGVGENHYGGFAEYACLKAKWLVETPASLAGDRSMVIGTGGLTAALCVQRILDAQVKPDSGPVVVTGASGGVGSFAVRLLAKMGYDVHAVSRPEATEYLQKLGASTVIDRAEFGTDARPLERQKWVAGVDTVGSKTLARILAEANYGSTITMCGLAGGFDLTTTVMPFILRGVNLAGVDSVSAPLSVREAAWQLLAKHLSDSDYDAIRSESIGLEEIAAHCEKMLAGQHQGRVVVAL